jgi:Ca-activated chloride channel homolog
MRPARLLGAGPSLLILAATGCSSPGSSQPALQVLAGSELKDMAPILSDIASATGWRLQMNYVGSLDGATQIASGTQADLAWFSTAKYL